MSDGADGSSVEEASLTAQELGISSAEKSKTGLELKQSLIESIGFIPVSTPETARVSRGVSHSDEPDEIAKSGYGFDRVGFIGNGEYLSNNPDRALSQIDQSHRGAHIIEFFAFPNMRKEVIQLLNGNRPPDGLEETLFARPRDLSKTISSSGMNPDPDLVLDSEFFEGYFDKLTTKWMPNPNYWENKLKSQAKNEGWDEAKYQKMRQLRYEEIKSTARQNLNSKLKQSS